ncbi:hypothetical protein Y1Q_0020637 [Alligator mississippiensis]|uniref:Uncharacterized protein n=1 Tax=Alligator mississippiensis TaxID=8496 RepID=A0A151NHL0_ALLMI|nr:hypothetical protein Y1Q_0020637 [Alligator mississippiensis]
MLSFQKWVITSLRWLGRRAQNQKLVCVKIISSSSPCFGQGTCTVAFSELRKKNCAKRAPALIFGLLYPL